MADLNITGDVKPGKDASFVLVQVGEAVVAGDVGYHNSTDNKYHRALNTGQDTAKAKGIFLTPAATDEYAMFQTGGTITIGATTAKGESYVLSAAAGKIAPDGDLVTNAWITEVGRGKNTTDILLAFDATNIQHA